MKLLQIFENGDKLEDWKQKVRDEYPELATKIKFKSAPKGEDFTIDAVIPGEERIYGMFDMNTEEGMVFGKDE